MLARSKNLFEGNGLYTLFPFNVNTYISWIVVFYMKKSTFFSIELKLLKFTFTLKRARQNIFVLKFVFCCCRLVQYPPMISL